MKYKYKVIGNKDTEIRLDDSTDTALYNDVLTINDSFTSLDINYREFKHKPRGMDWKPFYYYINCSPEWHKELQEKNRGSLERIKIGKFNHEL